MDLPEQIVFDFCEFLHKVYAKYVEVCDKAFKIRKENGWPTRLRLSQNGNFEVLVKKRKKEKWTTIL